MNAFFGAMVLLGCVWSAQSQYACTFPHGGDGGVFNAAGSYEPGNTKFVRHGKDGKIEFP